jgi:hypothetical protein
LDAVDKLWLHPKITNTQGAADLQGYWWTCVAVPAAPTTRVITPADWNLETAAMGGDPVGSPWPTFSMGNDNASFAGRQVIAASGTASGAAETTRTKMVKALKKAARKETRKQKKETKQTSVSVGGGGDADVVSTGMTDNSWLAAIWSGDFFMGPLDRPVEEPSPVSQLTSRDCSTILFKK